MTFMNDNNRNRPSLWSESSVAASFATYPNSIHGLDYFLVEVFAQQWKLQANLHNHCNNILFVLAERQSF